MLSLRCESGRADAGRFLGPIIRRVWDTTRARFAGRLVDDALDLRVASMFRSLAGERSPAVRRVLEHDALRDLFGRLFGEDARTFDYKVRGGAVQHMSVTASS